MKRKICIILSLLIVLASARAQTDGVPPAPTNLRVELTARDGREYVRLTWDNMSTNDTLTAGYFVYNNFPPENKLFRNGEINLLDRNVAEFELKSLYGAEYMFAITAVSAYPDQKESLHSNVVTIVAPSKKLPPVRVTSASKEGNAIKVEWDYATIADVAGFHVYVNKKKVTVDPVKEKSFVYRLPEEKMNKCMIQVKAVSRSGVESDFNMPVHVSI